MPGDEIVGRLAVVIAIAIALNELVSILNHSLINLDLVQIVYFILRLIVRIAII
jgi:hypothetical protein